MRRPFPAATVEFRAHTVPILTIWGFLSFALGVSNFFKQNFAATLKTGEKKFLRFFSAEPIFAERIETKVFFIFAFFFAEPIFAKGLGYLGLWDCSPILHRHTNVDHLDCGIAVQSYSPILHRHTNVDRLKSGIAVHNTDKHQQANVSDASTLQVGQTQHPSRNCGILQRRAGAKKNCDFFLRNSFLRRAQSQKIIFFCVSFFYGKTTHTTGN